MYGIQIILLLLEHDSVQFDVGVVHDKVFCHEAPQLDRVNYVKFRVVFKAAHQVLDSAFVISPVLFKVLHLQLSVRQLFVEATQIFFLPTLF